MQNNQPTIFSSLSDEDIVCHIAVRTLSHSLRKTVNRGNDDTHLEKSMIYAFDTGEAFLKEYRKRYVSKP